MSQNCCLNGFGNGVVCLVHGALPQGEPVRLSAREYLKRSGVNDPVPLDQAWDRVFGAPPKPWLASGDLWVPLLYRGVV